MPSPQQIKKIHALKGSLKLDDDTYRAILGGYGVTTSTKLTIVKADQLIDDLTIKATAAGVWKSKSTPNPRLGDDPQARKIRAQWWQLHKDGKVEHNTDMALCAFVKRMTGKDSLKWCSSYEKGKVINGLKEWIER